MTMIPLPATLAAHLRPNATLLVVPVEPQPLIPPRDKFQYMHDARLANVVKACPLTPGETYTAPDGSGYRVASVECRRVRSVTETEAQSAGFDGFKTYIGHGDFTETTPSEVFAESFTAAHGAADWEEDVWSWFITLESSERE